MIKDPWFSKGLAELHQGHWFDGLQMLQGAIQRAFRSGEPKHAGMVISKAIPLFASGNKAKLACDLTLALIMNISRNPNERVNAELIPRIFVDLRAVSLENCIQTIRNYIIIDKKFQESEFLSYLHNLILEARKHNNNVVSDLYYCYAGLFCNKKDFVSCFETLYSWSQEMSILSPKMRTYLTLAEINAYEIEDCGKYLSFEDKANSTVSNTENYLEIANRIFNAVQRLDSLELHSTLNDYSDLINPKNDGLLKALCDGISEILNDKSGLLSLFKS
ncbi:MAG: hypothetical protein ACFFB5_01625 [Promethearchaeota archaeon]